ncbi:hypothetical protein SPHV1_410046 [Novosphingobium sp. KN65.2]|nr:hypothetical protein SPHV1_410046 [Novosphingobium sp. KN65.2]
MVPEIIPFIHGYGAPARTMTGL